jgi:hypothetical protein
MHEDTQDRLAAAMADLKAAACNLDRAVETLRLDGRTTSRERAVGIALRDSRDAVTRAQQAADSLAALEALARAASC